MSTILEGERTLSDTKRHEGTLRAYALSFLDEFDLLCLVCVIVCFSVQKHSRAPLRSAVSVLTALRFYSCSAVACKSSCKYYFKRLIGSEFFYGEPRVIRGLSRNCEWRSHEPEPVL